MESHRQHADEEYYESDRIGCNADKGLMNVVKSVGCIGSYSVKLNIHYRLFFCNYLKTNIILNEVQSVHYNYIKNDPSIGGY